LKLKWNYKRNLKIKKILKERKKRLLGSERTQQHQRADIEGRRNLDGIEKVRDKQRGR